MDKKLVNKSSPICVPKRHSVKFPTYKMWGTPWVDPSSLLFILYINDFVEILKVMKIVLFADDTNIFMIEKSLDILIDTELILSDVRYLDFSK